MKPAEKRSVLAYIQESYAISQRRACGLINLARSSLHYESHPRKDHHLRKALRILAKNHKRWGVDTFTTILRARGWSDNHKRIYRVYCDEKLQVKRRKRRRKSLPRGAPLEGASRLNEIWGMDFVSDQLDDGRRFRALVILDLFSRECVHIEIGSSLSGYRVARALEKAIELRGAHPESILTDNGPEFRSKALLKWCFEWQVDQHFIEPGKPSQNGFVEGFNSTFRDQCLNEQIFLNIPHAEELIEGWRILYNTIKPHSALKGLPPARFAATQSGLAQTASKREEHQQRKPDAALA